METNTASMFELHIGDKDITSGSIPITWCVDKALLDVYKSQGIYDPQVIISIIPEDENGNCYNAEYKEQRFMAPLKDLMMYVDFKHPGKNRIFAAITSYSHTAAKNYWLERSRYNYFMRFLSDDGKDYHWILRIPSNDPQYAFYTQERKIMQEALATPLEVMVPQSVFAKEPPQWEKNWVLWLFSSKANDQCAYRKKRLFAYSIQPLIMLANIFARIVLLMVGLLIGSRALSLKPLFHPLDVALDDAASMLIEDGSIFIRRWPNEKQDFNKARSLISLIPLLLRKGWSIVFMPAILLPCLMLHHYGKLWILGIVLLIIVALISMVAIGAMLNKVGWTTISETVFGKKDPWLMDDEYVDMLVCNGQKKPMNVSDLPSKYKTVKLRFRNIKSKVCRPFAG